MTCRNILLVLCLSMATGTFGAESDHAIPWRQDQPSNQPYPPQDALSERTVPDGFTVEPVASEPQIVNPIPLAFDDRGRIWITESIEYPRKPAGVGRDRVKVLEDKDAEGRVSFEQLLWNVFGPGLVIGPAHQLTFAFLALDKPLTNPGAKLIPGARDISKPKEPAKTNSRLIVQSNESRLVVRAQFSAQNDWIELATYEMATNARPYLHPVRDASGRVVLTEDRPADHPWQHGIFTGFHRVNGFNYWKEDEGRQRFVRLLDLKEAPDRVSWRALVELVTPDGNVVLEEEDAITIHAPESTDTYIIDFDLSLRAREQKVSFGKFFVGGLSVRMPWDKANPRQTHLNSKGLRNRACEQQRAAWCTVERPFGNEVFGIAVFDHPANPNHPSGWRADEQGLINPNVSALGEWTLAAKQRQRFRYRLLVYRGSAIHERLARRFETFASDTDSGAQPRPRSE